MPILITMLRHGRSRADDEGVHEGRYDSPLTAVGQAQARARAAGWARAGVAFGRIVCSPLVRARETAETVGSALGVDVRVEASWAEFDNGRLAGLTFAEADRLFPQRSPATPYDRRGETGETLVELHCRAAKALQQVVIECPGSTLVVAHGGIINAAIRAALGMPLPAGGLWTGFHLGDTGYIRLAYDPGGPSWACLEFSPGADGS
jgi:2,3-bisphosphoglycerate-dependent phosphoglycerate mutase